MNFIKKVLRFFREIVESLGVGNVLLLVFVVWLIHSPLWLRLRVFLGFASEEEAAGVKAKNTERNDEIMDRWSKGISDSGNPLIIKSQKDIAWHYYLNGCLDKGLISRWKYWGLFALPDWFVSYDMLEKYKNLYLYGTDSDSK